MVSARSEAIRNKLADRLKPRADRIVTAIAGMMTKPPVLEDSRFVPAHASSYEKLVMESMAKSAGNKPFQRGTLPLIRSAPQAKITRGEYDRLLRNASDFIATTVSTIPSFCSTVFLY